MGQEYSLDTATSCVHITGLPVDAAQVSANIPQGTATIVVDGHSGSYPVAALPANSTYSGKLIVAGVVSINSRPASVNDQFRYDGDGTMEWLFSPALDPGSYTITAVIPTSDFKTATPTP